jgi:hypothetical protein
VRRYKFNDLKENDSYLPQQIEVKTKLMPNKVGAL